MEDARGHVENIVGTFIQRLEHLFMLISNVDAHDSNLKKIQQMVATSKRIIDTASGRLSSYGNRGRHY